LTIVFILSANFVRQDQILIDQLTWTRPG